MSFEGQRWEGNFNLVVLDTSALLPHILSLLTIKNVQMQPTFS